MFEITQSDGSTRHFHFHKNGKMDAPVCRDVVDAPSNRGVSQPVGIFFGEDANSNVHRPNDLLTTNSREPYVVGKKEAHEACTRLLGAVSEARSIDITDLCRLSLAEVSEDTICRP